MGWAQLSRLFAFGLAHELLETGDVGNPEVAPLTTQQTERGEPAQLARDGLAMRADAVCNLGE